MVVAEKIRFTYEIKSAVCRWVYMWMCSVSFSSVLCFTGIVFRAGAEIV